MLEFIYIMLIVFAVEIFFVLKASNETQALKRIGLILISIGIVILVTFGNIVIVLKTTRFIP
uniref:Uncharacterized protein n=1 Tax=Gloeothece verrucosa (strain PCC 7822) TaxID=497965 RepID=E0ULA4_GLOV7|nr:conserved hypothetical protein [Gloeothece verrucosa PCC 7822]